MCAKLFPDVSATNNLGQSCMNRLLKLLFVASLGGLSAPLAQAQAKKTTGGSSSAPASAVPVASSTAAFESQMLAFGALDHIASSIAKKVCETENVNKGNSVIIIYDQTAFANLQSYEAFEANRSVLTASYATLLPPNSVSNILKTFYLEESGRFATLAESEKSGEAKAMNYHLSNRYDTMSLAAIDPIADTTALLSAIAISANTETPGQIVIPDSAMAVALTNEINANCTNKGLRVIYPPLFGKGSTSDYASADLQADLNGLNRVRREAHDAVDKANKEFIVKYASQTTDTHQSSSRLAGDKIARDKSGAGQTVDTRVVQVGTTAITGDAVLTSALTEVNGLYDSFMNSLYQINSSTGVIGSASVIQGYQLASLLKGIEKDDAIDRISNQTPIADQTTGSDPYEKWKQRPAFVLLATIASAGGTELDHKTFWTALGSGDKISYSGGLIASVALWNAHSLSPLYANVLRYRVPFSRIKGRQNADDVTLGDNLGEASTLKIRP